jgi:hypothetical protein
MCLVISILLALFAIGVIAFFIHIDRQHKKAFEDQFGFYWDH